MMKSNGQIFPQGLWVVATPIGNVADLSSRAMQALKQADLILCEDTRRTATLLYALGFSSAMSRLKRLDAYSSPLDLQNFLSELQSGKSLALVTDAGTPSISDPGSQFIALAHEYGISITPFPGPSAVTALLSIAGFLDTSFCFRGFFPRKQKLQEQELENVFHSSISQVFVWFESPLRILETVGRISSFFPERKGVIAKELTKLHEKVFYGKFCELQKLVEQEISCVGKKGEWCFALHLPAQKQNNQQRVASDLKKQERGGLVGWIQALSCLQESHISCSEAIKRVSHHFDIPRKEVYAKALEIYHAKK